MLGLAIAAELIERFPERPEGDLARLRAHVVSRASCAVVARELDLAAELVAEGRRRGVDDPGLPAEADSVLSALVEAAIGAAFLTFGFAPAAAAVRDAFAERLRYAIERHVDAKTTLQEEVARRGRSVTYALVETSGPPHRRRFTSRVLLDGLELGTGSGATKKASEQAAAREALERLGRLP